jgi:CRP-like cAMP-binding protein
MEYYIWAFVLGALSAVSLVLGSVLGIFWKPQKTLTASFTAFGAGALLAALTIELVAPTAIALVQGSTDPHHTSPVEPFFFLILGCIGGGLLFVILDQLVNAKGGYLRKTATLLTFMSTRQKNRNQRLVERLSKIGFLRSIPPSHIQTLVDLVKPDVFHPDELIFKQGDASDRMFFVDKGEVALSDLQNPHIASVYDGDVFGEIGLLTGAPRTTHAKAVKETHVLVLLKEDFERMRSKLPEFESLTSQLASSRLKRVRERERVKQEQDEEWTKDALGALSRGVPVPTSSQRKRLAEEHSGAPLAIWLGILLDGIPESLVIGSGLFVLLASKLAAGGDPGLLDVIPYTLIAGLFLSNFPEALSSSVGMREQGWKPLRIIVLWGSILLATALGAVLGYEIGSTLDHTWLVFIEGLAAGAMLTMIAQTMIPEAVHLGGPNVVGLSTLGGFLAAVVFKLLE